MFGAIGTFVYRMRFAVIAVLIALMAGLGLYGLDLNKYLSQSGWFDPTSESDKGARLADAALGRDHKSDVILLITPPEGTTVDNPEFGVKIENFIDALVKKYPGSVDRNTPGIIDPFDLGDKSAATQAALDQKRARMFTADRKHAFISIGIKGNDDTSVLANFKAVEPAFSGIAENYGMQGTTFELAGLQPVAGAMANGMDEDIHRAEVIALPIVALMLFFVFGGVVAACLPVLIGGLTIAGSLGIMKILAQTTELNIFAQSVVTLIGLGIAIDYGLFIVSRFREELAEGYSTKAAVRRTVMTSGQTVAFSATIIVAALACLLMFPQGFLKSVAYGAIASVSLAALLSITVLPAILSILGPRIDMLSLPFLRRTRTKKEIEDGFWGRLSGWVMRHPVKTAVPTILLLLALIIPFGNIAFGGISEAYLPPDNPNRQAQEHFDKLFPSERTEGIKLVIAFDPNNGEQSAALDQIAADANKIPGFTKKFSTAADSSESGEYGNYGVLQMSAGLVDRTTAGEAIKKLRQIDTHGTKMFVSGTPTLTQDSIDALLSRLPVMIVLLVLVTSLLMFLAFGSVILPIKAALMSALGLGATLGILTWIFVDGHGASIANFTPGPLFAAMLVLIIAIVYGLSTDYEIFLLSRMVEARQKGASTTEAIRTGTAHTGRLITAAAAILVVVTGAFGLSDIVMMKYIAYGMIAALILDATIIRMLLVPSVMKLLGDDCWWAPRWMQRLQQKVGLGETVLDDEPDELRDSSRAHRPMSAGTLIAEAPTRAFSAQGTRSTTPVTDRPRAAAAPRRRPVPQPGGPLPGTGPQTGVVDAPAPDARPSGTVPVAPARPPGPAPQTPPPATPRPPIASRRDKRNSNGPDTGRWRLGKGGISLGGSKAVPQAPAPTPPPAPAPTPPPQQRPAPAPAAPANQATPAPSRPSTPPVTTAQPTGQRAVPNRHTSPPGPAPMPGGSSPLGRRPTLEETGRRPLAAAVNPEGTRPSSTVPQGSPMNRGMSTDLRGQTDDDSSGKRAARDDDEQISVQDLLRRSRNQQN
ncbi:MMPL family transporter [Gordonia sp. TBRC 11910]|uniref:MMPL family transporter n=1 Tax=Gordonia asplenii TaxID=2725283 RepID=A0A848KW40_9ACTN|nr:MMPL family transporter [Gordonia asplenii]NMO02462.1 MMPL family transporter [Gordonia asplenii]